MGIRELLKVKQAGRNNWEVHENHSNHITNVFHILST